MAFNFDSTNEYILEDDRVLLTPIKEIDFEHLLPIALSEPDTWKYSSTSASGHDGLQNYIADAVAGRAKSIYYPFIVFDKKNHQYAGSTRFYNINPAWQTVQLGYTWYGEKFRGTGLNKHCKFLLLQFAFETLNAARVELQVDMRNERSIAAVKSIGCTAEGILRSNIPLSGGGRKDCMVLSMLIDEWKNGGKENLKEKLSG